MGQTFQSPQNSRINDVDLSPQKHQQANAATSTKNSEPPILSLHEHSFRRSESVTRPTSTPWISRQLANPARFAGFQRGELHTKLSEALGQSSPKKISATGPTGDIKLNVETRNGTIYIKVYHLLNRNESRTPGFSTHTQRTITEITHALHDHAITTGESLRVEVIANQVINKKLQHFLEKAGFGFDKSAPRTLGRTLLEGAGVLAAGYALYAGTLDAYAIAGAMVWILTSTKGKSYSLTFEIQPPKIPTPE